MMGKHCILSIFLFLALITAGATDIASENWFKNISQAKQKITQLQLYVQDILSGPSPTTIPVAFANSTFGSPTLFGLAAVIDDPVRLRPSPNSEVVGQAQGFFSYSSLEEISLHMSMDIVFTGGEYNGSVLNVLGPNQYNRKYRELSVVGGTGAFSLARGVIGVTTASFNASTGDAFFEYNVTILHY